jgi:DNA polymerase III subunit delta
MTIKQIISDWRKGKADPVYLFYGDEEFLRNEALNEVVNAFLPDPAMRSFNLDQFYGNETKISTVIQCASGFPVMNERRVVIVRNAEKLYRFRDSDDDDEGSKGKDHPDVIATINYLEKPNFDCILILDCTKPGAKNTYPWKAIFAKAHTVDFVPLREQETADWIRERAKKQSRNLSERAAQTLVDYIGTDLRSQSTELEKVITYAGDKDEITETDVKAVVGNMAQHDAFELTKAIGAGNKKLASEIAIRMINEDKSARFPMFAVLIKYLEQLVVAQDMSAKRLSDKDIAAAIGLYGGGAYYVKEYISASHKFSRSSLDRAVKSLVGAEYQTRRAKIDESLLVQRLILEMMA